LANWHTSLAPDNMGGSTSSQTFDYADQLVQDTKQQSMEMKDSKAAEGEGVPRTDIQVQDGKLWTTPPSGATTLYELFQKSVDSFPNNRMLGTRTRGEDGKVEPIDDLLARRAEGSDDTYGFDWMTYNDVKTMSHNLGAGLTTLGNAANSNIGIFATNRAHWIVAQQGIYAQNMRVVSLYATLGDNAVEYITNHAELSTIVTSGANLKSLLNVLPKISHTAEEGNVRHIIRMPEPTPISDEDLKTAQANGVTLHNFNDIVAAGAEAKVDDQPPTSDDWAFIMYTSGTTGPPKGAILTHGNLIATLATTTSRIELDHTARHISYLPLAHIFETVVQATVYQAGGSVGFFQGSIKTLTDDMRALEPTLYAGVPRVFDKMYKKVMARVEDGSCAIAWYFHRAYQGTCEIVRVNGERDADWDKKVFNKIAHENLGLSKCKLIITGAAPCPPYLAEFLKVMVSCPVIQGYGMTETSAAASLQLHTDPTVGHNGPPLPCCEIKLVDVDEMGYHASDTPFSRGEIWVRGANIFKGYYKNPKATSEALNEDGWLLTGDIGRWNNNGTLSIIDRKKNIFKLSQGEYVAAEHVEQVYGKAAIVNQMFVYGNSYKPFVLGVVVPNAQVVYEKGKEEKWWTHIGEAENKLASPAFLAEYAKMIDTHREAITAWVHSELKTEEKALKSFERVRAIHVEGRLDDQLGGFTEANECVTPTFKLRRPYLLRRYLSELQALYNQNGEPVSPDEHWPGTEAPAEKKAEQKAEAPAEAPATAPPAETSADADADADTNADASAPADADAPAAE